MVIRQGVSISIGEVTDVGIVELDDIDPNADSDGDGVTDDHVVNVQILQFHLMLMKMDVTCHVLTFLSGL